MNNAVKMIGVYIDDDSNLIFVPKSLNNDSNRIFEVPVHFKLQQPYNAVSFEQLVQQSLERCDDPVNCGMKKTEIEKIAGVNGYDKATKNYRFMVIEFYVDICIQFQGYKKAQKGYDGVESNFEQLNIPYTRDEMFNSFLRVLEKIV